CSLGLNLSSDIPEFINIKEKIRLLDNIKRCDISLVMSDYMQHNLYKNGWNQERVRKLYPIYNVGERLPKPSNNVPVLLYVGQLIKGKGVDYLLQAVSKIFHPLRLIIVGAGNEETNIRNMIKNLKLEDRVELIGWTTDVEKYYRQADVVVVPSRWQEPFGLVGLEAFAYQTPVVAFNVGGISEWLSDQKTGLLAKPRDVKDLAVKIESLIGNTSLAIDLGKEGYTFVRDNFSEKKYLTEFYKIIEEIE
ncbi:MAG: glycosyltransferase family 4 protein, partial [Candidatus Cloacimonetes bacterium]|nr:glycosyltransferase family 4 protein [Candidatus Cloacimonadota bacterium]